MLQVQHGKCISCAETRTVQGDETLNEEEKEDRIRRLAHGVEYRFRVPVGWGPILPHRCRELVREAVVGVSAWGTSNHELLARM